MPVPKYNIDIKINGRFIGNFDEKMFLTKIVQYINHASIIEIFITDKQGKDTVAFVFTYVNNQKPINWFHSCIVNVINNEDALNRFPGIVGNFIPMMLITTKYI